MCGGIIRIFRILAGTSESYPAFYSILCDERIGESLEIMCAILLHTLQGCFQHTRPDNLFHNALGDPSSFVETNLSQQLAYTLYSLLSLHLHTSSQVFAWLRVEQARPDVLEEWLSRAEAMREAAIRKIDKSGFVQDVCGSPSFDRAGTAAEGQAWAIMMEVARERFLRRNETESG